MDKAALIAWAEARIDADAKTSAQDEAVRAANKAQELERELRRKLTGVDRNIRERFVRIERAGGGWVMAYLQWAEPKTGVDGSPGEASIIARIVQTEDVR